jgi:hypothetical protein
MAKKYVSTSRADRADDKRKRDANKAETKRNSRKRDLAIAAAGGAGALAAKTARSKVKLYNYNMNTAVNAIMKERPNLNRKEVVRDYRKTSAQLAMQNKITTGKNAEPRPFREKGESFRVKDASRLPKKTPSSRYSRLTGGGAAPGRGAGQGGRGGGGFLNRSK